MTTEREAFDAVFKSRWPEFEHPTTSAFELWQAACAWQRQQGSQPDMSALSLRKLDSLIADGYRVNGVAIRRDVPGKIPQQGFVTDHGMVGWWPGNEAPEAPIQIKDDRTESWRQEYRNRQKNGVVFQLLMANGQWIDGPFGFTTFNKKRYRVKP